MKTFLRLTMVFTIILFACNVWAQNRPLCPIDEITGMPILENIQGVCFLDPLGSWWLMNDGQEALFMFSMSTGVSDFIRVNSNDKGFSHTQDRDDLGGFLCTNPPCAWPPGGSSEWFQGPGTLTANNGATLGATGNFFATCPLTIRFKGELADQFGTGNRVNVHAFLTVVKDPELGCKASLIRIDVDPIEEEPTE